MISLVLLAALATAPGQVSHRRVTTADGVALALYRYSLQQAPDDAPPVLLLADAGFGRRLLAPLAEHLAQTGREVFVAELRGQGAADPGFSLRSVVHLDLPAIAEALGGREVDLVAHGYVGSLALAAAGRELKVRRVVGLATPFSPEPPTVLVRQFLEAGGRFSTLSSSPEGYDAFTQLFALQARGDPRTFSAFASVGARDLSRPVAAELATWMTLGDLPLDDGTTVLERLRAFDRPTLLLVGLADAWAPPEACVLLRERSKAKVEVRLFSRVLESDDFAHVALLLSARAPRDVFPRVEEFLR